MDFADVPSQVEFRNAHYAIALDQSKFVIADSNVIEVYSLPALKRLSQHRVKRSEGSVVCWRDANKIAWLQTIDSSMMELVSADAAGDQAVPIAKFNISDAVQVECDPSGGFSVTTSKEGTHIVDLSKGKLLATIDPSVAPQPGFEQAAIAKGGRWMSLLTPTSLLQFERRDSIISKLGAFDLLPIDSDFGQARQVAISGDGEILAVSGATLEVFTSQPPPPPVPAVALEVKLPPGFVDQAGPEDGFPRMLPQVNPSSTLPQLLLRAKDSHHSSVSIAALDRREFVTILPSNFNDDGLWIAFGKRFMARLFHSWGNNLMDESKAAIAALPAIVPGGEYRMSTGVTAGKRWIETREIWRDGCEPYDGYTKLVIDDTSMILVRVEVNPGQPVANWLPAFFDDPFRAKRIAARRRGPTSGPC